MSAICHGFVQNAWRKDHCTNCFRMRDEHEDIRNSVIGNNAGRSGNNAVNNATIVPCNNVSYKSGSDALESPEVKISQRMNRFLGTNSSSNTSLSSSGSSSSITRMNSGTAINQIGKISGTNNNTLNVATAQSSTKGHATIHLTLNGSRNNLIINSNHEYNDSNLSETLGKVKSIEAIQQLQKSCTSSSSSSSSLSSTKQQGKGIALMTNSHPSKSDNASVIPPPNHHNHNKPTMTSSAPAATVATGRNISSSFIASKNIFNNATTSCSSTTTTTILGSTNTASSNSSTTTPLLTGSTGCMSSGGGTVVLAVASNSPDTLAASSTCLSHTTLQSATSNKRGSIVTSQSSSSSSPLQQSLFKSNSGSEYVDFLSNKNLENHAKNGLIEKWEFSSDAVSNNNTIVGSCGKLAITINSQQPPATMNQIKGKESLDRRKVSASGNTVYVGGDPVLIGSSAKIGKAKGILRNTTGAKRRAKNVRFPEEVVQVIGYGGGPSGLSDDEDDAPDDPMDNASVTEVMEKNATTLEEKELHRLTQKNTNFNSIKTNLLGTTCIEIGPIVGCTGGKSMEGSSKALVSIGTFETRKEPLRIHKKISEDSADDELNEKTVEKHRKFIPRSSIGVSSTTSLGKPSSSSTQQPSKIATANTNSSSNNNNVTTTNSNTTVTTLSQKSHAKSTISSAFNSSVTTNKTSICSSVHSASSKSSSSISNKSAASSSSFDSKGNGSSTMIEVNPEQSSSVSSIMRGSKESIISERSKTSSSTVTSANRLNSSSNHNHASASSASTISKWSSNNTSTVNNDGNNSLRNKPVLKRIQQKNVSESSSSGEGYNTVEANNIRAVSSSSTTLNGNGANTIITSRNNNTNSNLIILTNSEKNNKVNSVVVSGNSSLVNKRNSFLRDIIVDSSTMTTMESTAAGGIEINQVSASVPGTGSMNTGSSSGGVQVICKNSKNDPPQADSVKKSELKVDLKPSVHNGKLSHPPFSECLSNRSNGTDDSSEFDDSLEDSGLDIKKCSEISESDEKSGSGSDSGNENDYSDRDRMKMISGTGPKSGLFISVDEVDGQNKKPEKLSPDSVLFSSASEMSASGSSESIPEALDTVSNGSSQKNNSGTTSGHESGSSSNSASPTTTALASTKRAAPRPPTTAPPDVPNKGNHAIYANSCSNPSVGAAQASIVEVEGLYDDVSFYKNPMHFPLTKENKVSAFEEVDEEEEENIYDDCTTLTANNKGDKQSTGGKSAMGSYNFQNGSLNDSDGDEETEKVVQRRSDGIEFIGIRKIDSESFLRERSPTPERSPEGKRERSSSASPKTRRRVNQFFSTIGKKAGAAFSQHVHGYSSKNKSSPVIEDSGVDNSPSGKGSSAYKRSMSTDEVSMTRTQEIYATLTPTSLKFKGLAPVLHKLSRMDLNLGDRDKGLGDLDEDGRDGKEKGMKKHKISSSIKKFLRFGSKDGESSGNKYDFGHSSSSQNKTESSQMITSHISEEAVSTESSSSRTPTPTMANPMRPLKLPERKPSYGTISGRPPPPPPPRVHSLDLLNRVGVVGPNGTVRPARPPPPSRHNRVAPSFTAVFNNPNGDAETKANGAIESQPNPNTSNGDLHLPDPNNPPSKPKRKASMNLDCVTNGISRDLETTYNHITTLNLETLKLIASQTPTKIRRSSHISKRNSPLRWSNFQIIDSSKPLIQGHGFVFYSASLEQEQCIVLVQEPASAPSFSAPFEFGCVETFATFEDMVPASYITWTASDFLTSGNNVRVFVSVMPKCSMYTVEDYMRHGQVPLLHKYFALLQSMTYWDKEDMSDLLVLVQSMEESDNSHFLSSPVPRVDLPQSSSPSSVLVYIHPIPHPKGSGGKRSSSKTQIYTEFETAMKQILLNNGSSDGTKPLLGDNDRQVLLKRLTENKTKTVQDQFRLFLQVKLFAPKRDSDELERIKKLRSERAIQQWLDRERALCMKEAVEQTLQRNVESISPYKRSYLEFLLTPENSAKAVLEMLIDLLE